MKRMVHIETKQFVDSGIIGTKSFVNRYYEMFKGNFSTNKTKKPKKITGLNGVYSLKRLANEK